MKVKQLSYFLRRPKKGRYGVASVDVTKFATSSSNGRQYHNGVDITEFIRFYPYKEWQKLSQELQNAIRKAKAEQGTAEGDESDGDAGKEGSDNKRKAKEALADTVKKLKAQLSTLTKQVSAINKKKNEEHQTEEKSGEKSETSDSETTTGPNAFAKGTNGKKKK